MVKEGRNNNSAGGLKYCADAEGRTVEERGGKRKIQTDLKEMLTCLEGKRAILTVPLEKGGENGAEE